MAEQQEAQMAAGPSRVNYETVFTNAKAGMEGVDAEKVKQVVYEASKNSAHFANEQRKEQVHEERIARMQAAANALGAAELSAHTAAMDAKLAELEATRDLSRTWLHVDMDAFFAAVEELERPDLRNRPFAVGGLGMISTANYEARKFGVRSAMPGFIALRLCPQLLFVRPDFSKYTALSERTRAVFHDYNPTFQAGSLDEAALDVTHYCTTHGMSGAQVAAQIRERVHRDTGLTCSVGIAPNRMLAKICSDRNKPNGQFELGADRDAVMQFVRQLGIRKVPGVGKVTQKYLAAFGVTTCGDLVTHRGLLHAVFSPVSCDFFVRVALGVGPTQHEAPPAEGEVGRRGISHERTFKPMSRRADLECKLRELACALAADMEQEGLRGRTLTLKIKHTNFELRTRAQTLPRHISSCEDLYAAAHRLLMPELPCELRLLGLRVSNFLEAPKRPPGQLSLQEMLARRQPGSDPQQQQQQALGGGHARGSAGGHRQQDLRAACPGADLGTESCGGSHQVGGRAEAGAAEPDGAGGEGDDVGGEGGVAVLSSQLSAEGELVELSLRDWQQRQLQQQGGSQPLELSLRDWQQQQGGAGCMGGGVGGQGERDDGVHHEQQGEGEGDDFYSVPPSLAVSPATAARFEQAAAGGGAAVEAPGDMLPPPQLPPARLDSVLEQAADRLAQQVQQVEGGGVQAAGCSTAGGVSAVEQGDQLRLAEPKAHPEQQQPQPPLQQRQPQQRGTWSCPACTFDNMRSDFWCQMCGTSRLGARRSNPAATEGLVTAGKATPGSSGSKWGGRSGGKGKGGRKRSASGAGPGGPSILRFMSEPRQPSPPAGQQEQQQHAAPVKAAVLAPCRPPPLSASHHQEQHHHGQQQQAPRQQQQQQQGEQQQGVPQQQQGVPQQQQQQEEQQQGKGLRVEGLEEGKDWVPDSADEQEVDGEGEGAFTGSDSDGEAFPPESPLLPGEDIMECRFCGDWVRWTRLQAHEDAHMAEQLQLEEERKQALMMGLPGSDVEGAKKRAAGRKMGGRQVTLKATLHKRLRQLG